MNQLTMEFLGVSPLDLKINFGVEGQENNWIVLLRYGARSMLTPFSGGSAVTDLELFDVVYCLVSDARGMGKAYSFEDWASEYGYDTDSRDAERVYRLTELQTQRLAYLLSHDFETFLSMDEDELREFCTEQEDT